LKEFLRTVPTLKLMHASRAVGIDQFVEVTGLGLAQQFDVPENE